MYLSFLPLILDIHNSETQEQDCSKQGFKSMQQILIGEMSSFIRGLDQNSSCKSNRLKSIRILSSPMFVCKRLSGKKMSEWPRDVFLIRLRPKIVVSAFPVSTLGFRLDFFSTRFWRKPQSRQVEADLIKAYEQKSVNYLRGRLFSKAPKNSRAGTH